MRNTPELAELALVSPAWVERALGISRQTRLHLEAQGVLLPVRMTPTSHRRYRRADVEALTGASDVVGVEPQTRPTTPEGPVAETAGSPTQDAP